jgi:D-tyrosyl-tRNA(Tyr) deacylase
MRAVIQRVNRAAVRVDGNVAGEIGRGLLLLIGVTHGDSDEDIAYLADKCLNMRLFPPDGEERGFERSVLDTGGALLVVSQFTLYASTRKGRRPSFTDAAPAETSEPLFARTIDAFRKSGLKVETGVFGATMAVELENWGPATIIIDTAERKLPRG